MADPLIEHKLRNLEHLLDQVEAQKQLLLFMAIGFESLIRRDISMEKGSGWGDEAVTAKLEKKLRELQDLAMKVEHG